jgi:hypothetical protein
MEPQFSLPQSQEPITCPCGEPDQSSPRTPILLFIEFWRRMVEKGRGIDPLLEAKRC